MRTLLLDRASWDLCLDIHGNIAIADEPYAIAQDVASACRLFLGELWYDTAKGIPYFEQVLGEFPPLSLVKTLLSAAAMKVPGVASVVVYLDGLEGRRLTGQIQITTIGGSSHIIGLTPPPPPPRADTGNAAIYATGQTILDDQGREIILA